MRWKCLFWQKYWGGKLHYATGYPVCGRTISEWKPKTISDFYLSVLKLLLSVKSVRTDTVYRIVNWECVKRCVAPTQNSDDPVTINGDGATHLKEYFYHISINGVSPNGLYKQQQLSYIKIFLKWNCLFWQKYWGVISFHLVE